MMNLTDGTENALGIWNHLKILCEENRISVWLNGILI